jgi:hypothetical protein
VLIFLYVMLVPLQIWWWGPCWLHWMFPFDSFLGWAKRFASNRYQPEATIMRMMRLSLFAEIAPARYGGVSPPSRVDDDDEAAADLVNDAAADDVDDEATPAEDKDFGRRPIRSIMYLHRGLTFKVYKDNTNSRKHNQRTLSLAAALSVASLLGVDSVARTVRSLRGVVINGQKRMADNAAPVSSVGARRRSSAVADVTRALH